jgi:hypothetical protein
LQWATFPSCREEVDVVAGWLFPASHQRISIVRNAFPDYQGIRPQQDNELKTTKNGSTRQPAHIYMNKSKFAEEFSAPS